MYLIRRIFIAISQTVNACSGGMPDEMLCSRLWRKKQAGSKPAVVGVWFFNTFFFWDKNHCKESYEDEVNQLHLPDELKKENLFPQPAPSAK